MLPELLLTVAYADRVLSSPQNSLLLVGRSGVGRHTVVKLLSVIHRCRVFTPQPAQNYSRKQFTNDLKGVNGPESNVELTNYNWLGAFLTGYVRGRYRWRSGVLHSGGLPLHRGRFLRHDGFSTGFWGGSVFFNPVTNWDWEIFFASFQVAGIYSNEELDVLLSPLKEIAAQEGHRSSLFTFFSQRNGQLLSFSPFCGYLWEA